MFVGTKPCQWFKCTSMLTLRLQLGGVENNANLQRIYDFMHIILVDFNSSIIIKFLIQNLNHLILPTLSRLELYFKPYGTTISIIFLMNMTS